MSNWRDEGTIKELRDAGNVWDVSTSNSIGFMFDKKKYQSPAIGDKVEIRGSGSELAGLKIGGNIVFDYSDQELEQRHQEWVKKDREKKKEDFEKNKAQMDKDVDELPIQFREKIARHRRYCADFRWQFEPYELFCCKEAVKIASYFNSKFPGFDYKKDGETEELRKAMNAFRELDYKEQLKLIPLEDEHSGNTFGTAMHYAYVYLTAPKYVHLLHAALSPLLGCEDAGCPPATKEELAEAGIEDMKKETLH